MSELEMLKRVSLFSLLDKDALNRLVKYIQRHHFKQGEYIIREGDQDNRLFIIVEGEVDVLTGSGGKKEKHLHTFGPFSYFGEMSLIDEMTRSASVVAKTDTQILSIEQSELRQEIRNNPEVAFVLLKMLSRRIRAMNRIIYDTLGRLAPMCLNCNKILENNTTWVSIEEYIREHSEIEVQHSICPDCSKKLFPQFYDAL